MEQLWQELTFEDSLLSQSGVGQMGTDEEKNHDEPFLLLHHIINPDLVSHEYPHEQIRFVCCIVQLLEILPFTAHNWKGENFVVILNFLKQLKHFGTSDLIIFKNCVIFLKILSKTRVFIEIFLCLECATNKENIYDAVGTPHNTISGPFHDLQLSTHMSL
jgi:hypothetical protein